MFNNLIDYTAATEVQLVDPVLPVIPPTQPLAPLRFGAARIPMSQDPSRPTITILEHTTNTNHNDYTIFISGVIRHDASYHAELLMLLHTLTPASKVTIFISSPGGSLHVGAMIASAIQTSTAEITTTAIGVVASAAALIWSYGKIRTVAEGAILMFHMSSHGDCNNSKEIKITAENTVRYVKEVALDPLVEQGFLTAEEVESIVDKRRNLWLDSATVNARLEVISHV